mmetsp:Transcript_29648/g.67979  ORF Transcript_29648/g.67979 Transcript_29648/m.67979 type:complete len:220 (-) Transcript_29648:70-729(-)
MPATLAILIRDFRCVRRGASFGRLPSGLEFSMCVSWLGRECRSPNSKPKMPRVSSELRLERVVPTSSDLPAGASIASAEPCGRFSRRCFRRASAESFVLVRPSTCSCSSGCRRSASAGVERTPSKSEAEEVPIPVPEKRFIRSMMLSMEARGGRAPFGETADSSPNPPPGTVRKEVLRGRCQRDDGDDGDDGSDAWSPLMAMRGWSDAPPWPSRNPLNT